jgi:hypothetical protein
VLGTSLLQRASGPLCLIRHDFQDALKTADHVSVDVMMSLVPLLCILTNEISQTRTALGL